MLDMNVSMVFVGRLCRKLNDAQPVGQSTSVACPLSYRALYETFDRSDFAQEKDIARDQDQYPVHPVFGILFAADLYIFCRVSAGRRAGARMVDLATRRVRDRRA
jgi:hypothetical protein